MVTSSQWAGTILAESGNEREILSKAPRPCDFPGEKNMLKTAH